MNTRLLLVCAVVVFTILAGGLVWFRSAVATSRPKLTPLVSARGGRPQVPLPKDALVLTVADGAEAVAPFVVHDEAGAVGGIAAFQPKGTRNDDRIGRIKFVAKTAVPGSYTAWVHGKWRDSCSNSCGLKVGAGTETAVGNDDVFNVWHWVPAGKHTFASGENPVAVVEREDGVFVDQVLFTQDAAYVPTGAITTAGVLRDVRRFADTFTRSPGHGNEGWTFEGEGRYDIAFSFDPNRIPNQYALTGNAKAGPCFALVAGAPWYGCKTSFTFMPHSDGEFGCVMDRNGEAGVFAGFRVKDGYASAFVEDNVKKAAATGDDTTDGMKKTPAPLKMKVNQWHRVVVEHWAWVTRIWLDNEEVLANYHFPVKAGKAGLFVKTGNAVFDDFDIEEIPWMADDGKDFKIDWTQGDGAKWFRADFNSGPRMTGETGGIKAGLGGIPLEEIDLDESAPEGSGKGMELSAVLAPGLESRFLGGTHRGFRLPPNADGSCTHATFSADKPTAMIRRVALRFGRRKPDTFNIGPYTFARRDMEDPSDYLDFTEEEYRKMAASPEAMKLQRQAKVKSVIGYGGEEETSPWTLLSGNWNIDTREGCLKGRGAGSRVWHAQGVASDMEVRFKVRLADAASIAEVELYAGADPGLRVQFADPAKTATPLPPGAIAARMDVPADKQWHEVTLKVDGSKLSAKCGRAPLRETVFKRGDGDRIYLKIANGAADFDDVEFVVQRGTGRTALYAFNQPEPDWWREPSEAWIDHGGIACVLASSWISLVAPNSEAKIWNKRSFAPNMLVTFNIEENSEWYGWDRYPTHVHFPFDNIEITLANEAAPATCYMLTVNAERHASTILYRNGKEVARVKQDRSFPMRYVGSHMPFYPRTNRICLIKRDGLLRGIVNGVEVIKYTDPEPLDVSKVGIGGHHTRINFSHIEIVNIEKTEAVPPAKPLESQK